MKDLQKVIRDMIIIVSKMKFTDKNISMHYNKKKELIIKINAGIIENEK